MIETEVKLRVVDPQDVALQILQGGFELLHERVFEANLMLDTPESALRSSGHMLRLRQAGKRVRLTFKDKSQAGPHKSREELEVGLDDFDLSLEIFRRLGYQKMFRYEKYRTEYADRTSGGGLAMLDETPIGNFLELEGAGDWIDRRARDLGFTSADYITSSYGALYLDHCRLLNIEPTDMTFA